MVFILCMVFSLMPAHDMAWATDSHGTNPEGGFPRGLDSYADPADSGIIAVLAGRIRQEPFNLAALIIFVLAIVHTFMTSRFLAIAHRWENEHAEKIQNGSADKYSVHHGAELFHFLGEVEVVFGIWVMVLVAAILFFYDWHVMVNYINHSVNFTEAMFVVVIMTLASTRPILKLAEGVMWKVASVFGGSITAWWFAILTMGPLLGSFITEPAAMTISALLLAGKIYSLNPGTPFKYATLGLLFVNISVGGTLSNFAAPPVLMVAGPWHWGMTYMLTHFGWKVIIAMLISNGLYYLIFRQEFNRLREQFALEAMREDIQKKYIREKDLEAEFDKTGQALNKEMGFAQMLKDRCQRMRHHVHENFKSRYYKKIEQSGIDMDHVEIALDQQFEKIRMRNMRRNIPGFLPENERPTLLDPDWNDRDMPVPAWIVIVHVLFMAWTILNAHYPALFIAGLLFFLGFAQVTSPYQNRIDLKPPLLVGFFLGGLVIHGGVQGWWIAPVLGGLDEVALMFSSTILTAFNDNAAITYLCTLVPNFTDSMKYAVVAGAVAGGGLTVIANAPNPAGQAILKKYFDNGISPALLFAGALLPTLIVLLIFFFTRIS